MCAIKEGKSLDTTMGLTPVSGLPGATRSGAIDPSLIFHYTNRAGRISHDRSLAVNVQVTEAEDILNKRSGWNALTGTTDFGEIVKQMKEVDARLARGEEVTEEDGKWRLAFDLFLDRILGYLGGYYVKLGGKVDALVFAGGIGERSVELREAVVAHAACVGFSLDPELNKKVDSNEDVVVDVGLSSDGHHVLVCRTDEQVSFFVRLPDLLCLVLIAIPFSTRWRRNVHSTRGSGRSRLLSLFDQHRPYGAVQVEASIPLFLFIL